MKQAIIVRDQAYLQRKVDAAVAEFQHALDGALFKDGSGRAPHGNHPGLRAIYNAVFKLNRPVDYRGISEALHLPVLTDNYWRVSCRLRLLTTMGYLKVVGEGPLRYRWKHGAKLYRAVPPEQIPIVQRRIDRARKELYDSLDKYTARAIDRPQCLARQLQLPTADSTPAPFIDRNIEILKLRVAGWSLERIGTQFGLSRERVRQIQYKSLNGKSWATRRSLTPAPFEHDEQKTLNYLRRLPRNEGRVLAQVARAIRRDIRTRGGTADASDSKSDAARHVGSIPTGSIKAADELRREQIAKSIVANLIK